MKRLRKVSDVEFEAAWNNTDNRILIKSETGKYYNVLTVEERNDCGLAALWKALQYYKKKFGQKFTTSLYRFVHWECKRQIERNRKRKPQTNIEFDIEQEKLDDTDLVFIREKFEAMPNCWQKRWLKQHFFEFKTVEQIAKRNRVSRETARQRLKQAVKALRDRVLSTSE